MLGNINKINLKLSKYFVLLLYKLGKEIDAERKEIQLGGKIFTPGFVSIEHIFKVREVRP